MRNAGRFRAFRAEAPAGVLTTPSSLPDRPHRRYNGADFRQGGFQGQAPAAEYLGSELGNRPAARPVVLRRTPAALFSYLNPGAGNLNAMDAKLKHLEFIQGVINRLATNSFRLKGWTVVLVAALFALLSQAECVEYASVALVPIIFFWGLDAYFLWQERLFRALYDHVRVLTDDNIDFSMDVGAFRSQGKGNIRWRQAVSSRTLFFFYGALTLAVCIATWSSN